MYLEFFLNKKKKIEGTIRKKKKKQELNIKNIKKCLLIYFF